MPINRWGAYICDECWKGKHLGTRHFGICDCTCDGKHDAKGKRIVVTEGDHA